MVIQELNVSFTQNIRFCVDNQLRAPSWAWPGKSRRRTSRWSSVWSRRSPSPQIPKRWPSSARFVNIRQNQFSVTRHFCNTFFFHYCAKYNFICAPVAWLIICLNIDRSMSLSKKIKWILYLGHRHGGGYTGVLERCPGRGAQQVHLLSAPWTEQTTPRNEPPCRYGQIRSRTRYWENYNNILFVQEDLSF